MGGGVGGGRSTSSVASVAGRELFLNRTTLNDFLLNYAALTFNYVNGKVL